LTRLADPASRSRLAAVKKSSRRAIDRRICRVLASARGGDEEPGGGNEEGASCTTVIMTPAHLLRDYLRPTGLGCLGGTPVSPDCAAGLVCRIRVALHSSRGSGLIGPDELGLLEPSARE
jgi:hypothetical protein